MRQHQPLPHTNVARPLTTAPDDMTPASWAAQRAAELMVGELGVWTDAESYAGRWVLVGVARPCGVCVLQIPAAEYDGITLTRLLLNVDLMARQAPDINAMRQQKKELQHGR